MTGLDLDAILRQADFAQPEKQKGKIVYLVANGDLRDSANQVCWPEQEKMEAAVKEAFNDRGYQVIRAHQYDPKLKHGFINSQAMGNQVFHDIPVDATVVVAESVWEYSHHILGALVGRHDGKILTIANYSGTHPGLVGMSNLNASLLKHGRDFATVWSEDFTDDKFNRRLNQFLKKGFINYDHSHIHDWNDMSDKDLDKYAKAMEIGEAFARRLLLERAIMGPLDEMCMGMENAVIPNDLLYHIGIGKENISQSELLSEMRKVSRSEAKGVIEWCRKEGMTFHTEPKDPAKGPNETTDLTERQLLEQGRMYVAAVRIAEKYGLNVIGIQYQQGLKDCCAASDLAEGLLNNPHRPPVTSLVTGNFIRPGRAIPNMNEVDQGCGVDLVLSDLIWNAFGEDPSANQEDVRWSRPYSGEAMSSTGRKVKLDNEEVWVELLSGSAPASQFAKGYKSAHGYRQPGMYFPLGGSTLSGEGKPGEVVVSRVFIDSDGSLSMNLMRGAVVGLPHKETQDRLDLTTPQWPIKSLVRYGVDRDAMIQHPSNHETVLYASSADMANTLMFAKAAMANALGMNTYRWGNHDLSSSIEAKSRR